MKNDETIHDRVSQMVDYFGDGKNTVFAKIVGESEANVRGYRANVLPKQPFLEKVVRSLEVSHEWLLTGEGSMTRADEPPSPGEQNHSRELEMCRALLREKDALNLEQAKEIGRLEERISHFQTSSRKQPSYGGDVPFVDLDATRNVSRVRDASISPRTYTELTERPTEK
ncbi:MAG: hypothetical protein LBV18_03870 [Alistipes sp.]|jgi:hypothetical protein|nr:hypothetical protein [Alistipes sp.]